MIAIPSIFAVAAPVWLGILQSFDISYVQSGRLSNFEPKSRERVYIFLTWKLWRRLRKSSPELLINGDDVVLCTRTYSSRLPTERMKEVGLAGKQALSIWSFVSDLGLHIPTHLEIFSQMENFHKRLGGGTRLFRKYERKAHPISPLPHVFSFNTVRLNHTAKVYMNSCTWWQIEGNQDDRIKFMRPAVAKLFLPFLLSECLSPCHVATRLLSFAC